MPARTLAVTRIAETELAVTKDKGIALHEWMESDVGDADPDVLAEFSGRACYLSFRKPNPKTRANVDYIDHIIEVEHFSVLGHASVSYYVEGASRSLTHELIRHRFLVFSQLSQRYVKLDTELDYVVPPAVQGNEKAEAILARVADYAVNAYQVLLRELTEANPDATPKQLREAARAVLPGMTETKIVVSGNLRAWRDFLEQRLAPGADAEIFDFAQTVLKDLAGYAPNTFGDFKLG